MRINIDLDTSDATDLAGLTALIAALGGGVCTGPDGIPQDLIAATVRFAESLPAVPPPAPEVPESERLLQALADSRQPTPASAPSGGADDETPNANAPATDSRGYPWDERVHASTKAVNGDGTWRNKRGVDKGLLGTVESLMAEMLNAQPAAPDESLAGDPATPSDPAAALGTPPATGGATVPPPPPAPGSLAEQMAAVAAGSGPGIVPPPPPPAEPAAPAAAAGDITFPAILKLAETKDKSFEELTALARQLGLDKFQDLVKRSDLFESFVAALG